MIQMDKPAFDKNPAKRQQAGYFRRRVSGLPEDIVVSIITPYYNAGDFIEETAISLFNQTFQYWEWIIVDDGSTDAQSINQLKKLEEKDDRIKVFHQKNAGPSAARNAAFRHARGRYLCILDSDDLIEPIYLEQCIWFLEANKSFSFCNSFSVVFGEEEYLWPRGFEQGARFVQANAMPPISVIRREAFQACGGFDESINFGHEDWNFWLSLANIGLWGYTLPEYLQWYRKRHNGRFEQFMRSEENNQKFAQEMQQRYQGLAERFPQPARRIPEPFEPIETEIPSNLLDKPAGRKRILFLWPWMVTGGADQVNYDIVSGLLKKNYDITICTTLKSNNEWKYRFAELTSDIFVLPEFLSRLDYARFLNYLIVSRQIDVVVIYGSTIGYLLLPYLRAMNPKTTFVDLCHVEEMHWNYGGHPRFSIGYQDLTDINIVSSRHLANWMEKNGADRSRIEVYYTGVAIPEHGRLKKEREDTRQQLQIATEEVVIIFAGRLVKQKRPDFLMQILIEAKAKNLPFKAIIIGDGPMRTSMEADIRTHQLQSVVTMMGTVPHARWLSLVAASDVFLLPSDYEGISLGLLEAMAAGVIPVIADVGGQGEIVGEGMGYRVAHGEAEKQLYIAALERLIGNPSERHAMSEKSRQHVVKNLTQETASDTFVSYLIKAEGNRKDKLQTVPTKLAKEMATFAMEHLRVQEALEWYWRPAGEPPSGAKSVKKKKKGIIKKIKKIIKRK